MLLMLKPLFLFNRSILQPSCKIYQLYDNGYIINNKNEFVCSNKAWDIIILCIKRKIRKMSATYIEFLLRILYLHWTIRVSKVKIYNLLEILLLGGLFRGRTNRESARKDIQGSPKKKKDFFFFTYNTDNRNCWKWDVKSESLPMDFLKETADRIEEESHRCKSGGIPNDQIVICSFCVRICLSLHRLEP